MTKRPDHLFIRDMRDHAAAAINKVAAVDRQSFLADETLHLAVTHHVVVLGEAAHRVDPSVKERHPQVPWIDAADTRNRLVHGYYSVDQSILFDIVTGDLPALVVQLDRVLKAERP